MSLSAKVNHYFLNANPYKTVDSVKKLLSENLHPVSDLADLVILNKPPGLALSNKNTDNKNLIQSVKETLKVKLNWKNALMIPITTEQSGAFLFTSNHKTFGEVRKLMLSVYPTYHFKFLKFYAITTHIPLKRKGSEFLHFSYDYIDKDLMYFKINEPVSRKQKKFKVISCEIGYEVLDANEYLDVALVRFETGMQCGDEILAYTVQNLAPVLGDHLYSSRVTKILHNHVLVPDQKLAKPKTQEMSERLMQCLKINKYLTDTVPLHLQAYEIDMPKMFKQQSLVFKKTLPISAYFEKSMVNLGLKLPANTETEKKTLLLKY